MKVVRFIKNKLPYGIGETAGFDDTVADTLIFSGAAVYVVDASAAAEPAVEEVRLEVLATVSDTVVDRAMGAPTRRAGQRR